MKYFLQLIYTLLIVFFSSCSSAPNYVKNIENYVNDSYEYSKEKIERLEYTRLCNGIEIARIEDMNIPIIMSIAKVSLKNKDLKIIATEKERFKRMKLVFPETTYNFAKRRNTNLAVNANFFNYKFFFLDRFYKTLGLFINDGTLLSPYNSDFAILSFRKDNSVFISNKELNEQTKEDVICAISGLNKVIEKGSVIIEGKSRKRNSRTLIGVDKAGESLFILCIDGENKRKSRGETLFNASMILKLLGGYEGIELDGGGSTSLIAKIQGVHSQLIPATKIQKRRVAINLGFVVEENESNQ